MRTPNANANRRRLVLALPALAFAHRARAGYPAVEAGRTLVFPRDHGAHPQYRTEWWYITGWVRDARGRDLGVQITFFRNRPLLQEDNPSAFAPTQLLFAHAALADPAHGRLRHDQRAAREGFGLALAREGDTDVRIDDWWLRRDGGSYRARIVSRELDFALTFAPAQPVLLQGDEGFSRKGPRPQEASYYYSRPHLRASGELRLDTAGLQVQGQAWLDHEWASQYLAPEAAGWDWTGLNLDDGAALVVFRMRAKDGTVHWAAATLRDARGRVRTFGAREAAMRPLRTWRSPRTGVEYPVGMRVQAGAFALELEPLMDDQELDARASTGTIYWEGAVRAMRAGREVGRGYLELTGYWSPLKL
jgi:predicted secreted hydrolase